MLQSRKTSAGKFARSEGEDRGRRGAPDLDDEGKGSQRLHISQSPLVVHQVDVHCQWFESVGEGEERYWPECRVCSSDRPVAREEALGG
jgi:hypothetical protein